MKPEFHGFDFDGTIVSQASALEAGKRFFEYFSEVLDDRSVRETANRHNFLEKVYEVMGRMHGKVAVTAAERARYLSEARDYYKTINLEIIANNPDVIINKSLVLRIKRLKREGNRIACISTTQVSLVEPALVLLGIRDLFDVVLASSQDQFLKKQVLLEEFQKRHGVIVHYTGDSDEDEDGCRALGIPFTRVESM